MRPAVLRIYDPLETSLTISSELLKKGGFEGGAAMVVIFEGRKALARAVWATVADGAATLRQNRPARPLNATDDEEARHGAGEVAVIA